MVGSALTRLVQSFSVVFLYWFYVFSVNQLKDQNKQLSMALSITSQNLVAVQAQNSVLQTQKMELDSRLGALTEILWYMNSSTSTSTAPTNPAIANDFTAWSRASDILGGTSYSAIDLYQCF
ncbi:hypothetical protein Zm00014a_042178 [Zea mays]|uniref:Uncharacterized protein n=2 Tax=Zea mays TaxID=4577 RepID=A0A1D6I1N7_MAIZE|nr:hypothetical protein ZEAMMB73_Zm00001d020025 [Zea mays]PWZ12713.1 hypothetical protein Zm00014a_042178 [Zea mays]